MAFALPCLSIVMCYARIFYIVRKTAMRTQEPITNNVGSVRIPQNKKNKNHNNQIQNTAAPIKENENKNHHENGIEEKELLQNECHEIVKIENGCNDNNYNGVTVTRNNSNHQKTRPYLSKIDGFKFIDTSFESELLGPTGPKSLSVPEGSGLDSSLNTSTSSINKTVDFTKTVNETIKEQQEVDSAFEVSTTSSADKYQVSPSFCREIIFDVVTWILTEHFWFIFVHCSQIMGAAMVLLMEYMMMCQLLYRRNHHRARGLICHKTTVHLSK